MDTGTFLFLIAALAPAWVPPLRLLMYLFNRKLTAPEICITWYVAVFIFAAGGVSFQLAIQIPSGIGYALVILLSWPMLLICIAKDPFFMGYVNTPSVMNMHDFGQLLREKLNEAVDLGERSLGKQIPRNLMILRDSPKSDERRISVEQAISELFVSDDKFYNTIELTVVEVSPTTTWIFADEKGDSTNSFDKTLNQPPGSGPFKPLMSNKIRTLKEGR
jgi:hypothetical protein